MLVIAFITMMDQPQEERRLVDTTTTNVPPQGGKERSENESPTGVADALTQSPWNNQEEQEQPSFSFDAIVVQASALLQTMQIQVEQTQKRLTWDRQFVMTCILTALASVVTFAITTACCFGGIALVTAPFWLPVAILTSPVWILTLFVSSPVWVTVLAITGFMLVSSTTVIASIVLFFGWPQEWLPENNKTVAWFLDTRQRVELYLIKWQAKLLLYAAGVGPAADAAFLILDRIDLKAVRERLSEMDVERLKHLDVSELQALVWEAVHSLMK